eukprot:CAMPEP_0196718658 /NCGR_PEP_ID=MMETSP1091-20130531/1808_1 /TAXON_ID=302021 /ORGANISM="Rhodomonas sp., Strain CCMP768" /LENGTH=381 /DNA_ID=CAMNT_0042059379 /DNA_START=47 /DNA_END=1192 /DNA_ORIENTATION=+
MVCVSMQQSSEVSASVQTKLAPVASNSQPLHGVVETNSSSGSFGGHSPPSIVPVSAHAQTFMSVVRSVASNRIVDAEDVDFDNYEKLGQGSIARVYKATLQGRSVAIKMLRTDLRKDKKKEQLAAADMLRELKVVVSLPSHPNIVGFFAAGLAMAENNTKQPVMVYEYLGAGSVESVFQAKRNTKSSGKTWTPPKDLSLEWCQQLFAALAFLHALETPLAHRDVKPANLLISADMQTVKLCDFSLATPLHSRVQSYSNLPSIAGSMRYMAPEVAVNAPFSLEKTDIYSAAMTSFFLVHGRKPFTTLDANAAQDHATAGHRPAVDDAQIAAVLGLAWAVAPSKRPGAAEVAQQFGELRAGCGQKKPSLKKRILGKLGLTKAH